MDMEWMELLQTLKSQISSMAKNKQDIYLYIDIDDSGKDCGLVIVADGIQMDGYIESKDWDNPQTLIDETITYFEKSKFMTREEVGVTASAN